MASFGKKPSPATLSLPTFLMKQKQLMDLRREGSNSCFQQQRPCAIVHAVDSQFPGTKGKRRCPMAKYLYQSSYTTEGVKGLLKDGGSKRRAAAEEVAQSLGGKVEAFYFAFGGTDAYVIIDLPDNASAAAGSLAVSASGAIQLKTTVLLTPEEMDSAAKKSVSYSPPGK
jgi:uncharacterized protein with GYD domain